MRGWGKIAGLAILAERNKVEFILLAWCPVNIPTVPRVVRHSLAQIGSCPLRLVIGSSVQCRQALLCRGIVTSIEAVLVECLFEGVDLRARNLNLRLALLSKVTRRDVARQKADDHDHHQQFKQGKTSVEMFGHVSQAYFILCCGAPLLQLRAPEARWSLVMPETNQPRGASEMKALQEISRNQP